MKTKFLVLMGGVFTILTVAISVALLDDYITTKLATVFGLILVAFTVACIIKWEGKPSPAEKSAAKFRTFTDKELDEWLETKLAERDEEKLNEPIDLDIEQKSNNEPPAPPAIKQDAELELTFSDMREREKFADSKKTKTNTVIIAENSEQPVLKVKALDPPSYINNRQMLEMLIALFDKKPEYRDMRSGTIMYIVRILCENTTNLEYIAHITLTADRYFRYIQQKCKNLRGKTWEKRQRQSGRKVVVDLTTEQQAAADAFLKQLKLF